MAVQSAGTASGTAGHIQFSDGSGGFNSDSNAIFWDGTNNRLGVNTGSPAYSIDTTASGTVRAATFTGALAGNATTATTATLASTVTVVDSTDTSSFIAMFDSATGSLAAKTDAGLTYNAGTGMLTATGFTGPLTGNATTATALAATGNIAATGDIAWNVDFSGTNVTAAATITAAQTGITSIYNTSLKMGRDSQNLIDFATTDNKIILRVNNVDEVELVENALSPVTASGVDLGTASLEWGNIYIGDDKKIYFGTGSDATIEYDEDGTDQLRIAGNTIFEDQVELTKDLLLDSTPADPAYSGITAKFTAGETLEAGEVVYLKAADTRMWKAVANVGGTGLITSEIMCVAMAAEDIAAGAAGVFLLQGFLQDNTNFPTYTVGETLYVPEAEQGGQNVPHGTIPTTDGDMIQIIGWASDANTVYFNPDFTIIEHA